MDLFLRVPTNLPLDQPVLVPVYTSDDDLDHVSRAGYPCSDRSVHPQHLSRSEQFRGAHVCRGGGHCVRRSDRDLYPDLRHHVRREPAVDPESGQELPLLLLRSDGHVWIYGSVWRILCGFLCCTSPVRSEKE